MNQPDHAAPLPCPFCGCPRVYVGIMQHSPRFASKNAHLVFPYCECENCLANTYLPWSRQKDEAAGRREAVAQWNTRGTLQDWERDALEHDIKARAITNAQRAAAIKDIRLKKWFQSNIDGDQK